MHYQEKLDKIFADGSAWSHRTFRTVFDPYSAEYSYTSMEQKVEFLRRCHENGLAIDELVDGYKVFYWGEKKQNVIASLEDGLLRLTIALLNDND